MSAGLQRLLHAGPPAVVNPAIARALDRENEYTVGVAVRERMSFPRTMPATMEGLRVQTSRLRRSITRSRARIYSGGVISSIGSNVQYFGTHEFGFQGVQAVRAHRRKLPRRYFIGTGQAISHADAGRAGLLTRQGKLRRGFGEEAPTRYVAVRAHRRRANVPAREMVQRTVRERMPQYALAMAEEIQRALA